MARHRRTLSLALAFTMLALSVPTALAQRNKKNDGQDPTTRDRNVRPEMHRAYKDWIERDVSYIITEDERKAW